MASVANRLKDFDSRIFQEVFHKIKTLNNPIDLSIGVPEEPTPDFIKLAGMGAIYNNQTKYTPANGILALRQAIAKKLAAENAIAVDPAAISLVPGLTTGLLIVYLATLNPGDEVLIMDPSYPPYSHLASVAGAAAIPVPTLPDFQLDLAAITAAITPKTRLIVINTPNNPTGAVYHKADLLKLAAVAKKHDIIVVSDEMYESFLYRGEHFSIGSIYPNTITMNGFSKSHAMTGWRLGYVAGPQVIIDAINQLQQYIVFCPSSIAQHAALASFDQLIPTRPSYVQKRQLIFDRLQTAGYHINGSDGAYYTYFEVPKGLNDMEFVELAAKHNLILLPGRAFSRLQTFVRLSYGGSMKDVEKGLDIITKITRQVNAHD